MCKQKCYRTVINYLFVCLYIFGFVGSFYLDLNPVCFPGARHHCRRLISLSASLHKYETELINLSGHEDTNFLPIPSPSRLFQNADATTFLIDSAPRCGAADAEIKVPSGENTELEGSTFKTWGRSVYSHTWYASCQRFLPCLFLPFRSIYLHFSKTSPDFSCVGCG